MAEIDRTLDFDDVEIAADDDVPILVAEQLAEITGRALGEPIPVLPAEPAALMAVLPADFPLPALVEFVPNVALKTWVADSAAAALAVEVHGIDGLEAADRALVQLRASVKGVIEHFAEPTEIANRLHKRLTGLRGEWLEAGEHAEKIVGRRIYIEKAGLEAIEAEARRKVQAEADAKAREEARRKAEEAEKAKAPAPVVENLKREAETATAAPVVSASPSVPTLKGSTTVITWRARLKGTGGRAEQPTIAGMDAAERAHVLDLLKAILEDTAPLAAIELNWRYLDARAKADQKTFNITGIEAYADGGTRAKGGRK